MQLYKQARFATYKEVIPLLQGRLVPLDFLKKEKRHVP